MNPAQLSPEVLTELELLRARLRDVEHFDRERYEHSLSLLQATLDGTADGLLVVDLNGNVVLHNAKFLAMWRVPPELAVSSDDSKLLAHVAGHFENPAGFVKRVQELYAQPDEEYFDEIVSLDGRIIERYSKAQRIGGRSVGRVWSFRDITERRRTEQLMRDSEARYRHLFAHVPLSIWETDYTELWRWLDSLRQNGVTNLGEYFMARPEAVRHALKLARVVDVSDSTLLMFDATDKAQLIANLPALFTDEAYYNFGESLAAIRAGCTKSVAELAVVTLTGRRLDVLIHWAIPVEDGRPNLSRIVIAIDDITERVRLQHELLKAQKLESIGTLAGGIAHDFNNLLAVVVGQGSMMLRGRSLPARVRESLEDILHAAERGSALTKQLLAYARGGLQQPAPVNLNAIIESVMKILHCTLPPQVEFATQLSADLPQVMADPSQIEQVMMNLCLNAAQASRVPGRVEVTTDAAELDPQHARQWTLPLGHYVRVVVRDFGRGMGAAVMARIFEPFFTTKPEGRGMGLAVTLGIIKSHKGHIDVISAPHRGTTMTVWLPAIKVTQETAAIAPARPRTMPLPRGSETVLVVDDDAAVRRTVETMLASLGYCVVARGEPEETFALLKNNAEDVHLVILDANLPRFSLAEVFDRVHSLCPHAPVLLASGFALQHQCEPILKQGAAGFIQKPFSIAALATQVRAALDKPRA